MFGGVGVKCVLCLFKLLPKTHISNLQRNRRVHGKDRLARSVQGTHSLNAVLGGRLLAVACVHAMCHLHSPFSTTHSPLTNTPRCLLLGVVHLVRLLSSLFRLSLRAGGSGTTSTTALSSSFRRSRAIAGRGTLAGRPAGEGRPATGVRRLEAAKPGENKVRANSQYSRVMTAMLYTAVSTWGGGLRLQRYQGCRGHHRSPCYLGYFTTPDVLTTFHSRRQTGDKRCRAPVVVRRSSCSPRLKPWDFFKSVLTLGVKKKKPPEVEVRRPWASTRFGVLDMFHDRWILTVGYKF